MPQEPAGPADAEDRERAVRETERNVLVVAGAGSGKTSLLVERCLHLLLERGLDTRDCLAITFTDLAAREMRRRVRAALESLTSGVDTGGSTDAARAARRWITGGGEPERLTRRAADVLADFDRCEITTIHGYGSGFLRRQALAAGIPFDFELDKGPELERFAAEAWRRFLAAVPRGDAAAARVFDRFETEDLHAWFAAMLEPAFDHVDVDAVEPAGADEWIRARASTLLEELAAVPASPRSKNLTEFVAIARDELAGAAESGAGGFGRRHPVALPDPPVKVKALTAVHAATLRRVKRFCNTLREVDDGAVREAVAWLAPAAAAARAEFLGRGFVTYDGLVVKTRDLLRDRLDVRAAEGRRYRAILVDEFQDTDPLQYEIVFLLAEAEGPRRAANPWSVKLVAGKLFLVGDPKQSIYRFRGADIRAYAEAEVKVLTEGGIRLALHANFRSPREVLTPLDALFGPWIGPRDEEEREARAAPDYEPMVAFRREPKPEFGPAPRVEVLAPVSEAGISRARDARCQEAEVLAAEIGASIAHGRRPADHAVLLRSFTDVGLYTTALDKRGIPYFLEGGRGFYTRPEVLELLAWLRAVAEPNDAVALLAALRGAAGAVPDGELERFAHGPGWAATASVDPPSFPGISRVFEWILGFRGDAHHLTAAAVLHRILARTRLVEIHAAAHDGAQRVVNLQKCQEIAEALAHGRGRSFSRVVAELARRVETGGEEAERAVAGEDAVSILTIHKAKGLEFPCVYLVDLDRRADARGSREARLRPRSTSAREGGGLAATTARSGIRSLGSALDTLREEAHAAAEGRRLLYVALTRARERLSIILSPEPSSSMGPWCERLAAAWPMPAGWAAPPPEPGAPRESGGVSARWVPLTPPPRLRLDGGSETLAVNAARALTTLSELARSRTRAPLVAPTALSGERLTAGDARLHGRPAARTPEVPARLVGTAVHALLERADFAGGDALLPAGVLEIVCAHAAYTAGVDPEGLTRRVKPLWARFEGSQLRLRLANTVILARELRIFAPFPMTDPLPSAGQAKPEPVALCSGVADLVFEEDGRWIAADWKTDDVKGDEDLTAAVERHRAQVRFYAGALSRVSTRPVEAEIFFVRVDRSVRL